jgi:hypothetical protein
MASAEIEIVSSESGEPTAVVVPMTPIRFYNVWRTKTPQDRARLIASMRERTEMFAAKPGFVSLIVSESSEDGRVVAEGLWATKEAYENAVVNNPDAHAGREQMAAFGTPEPGVFLEAFRVEPAIDLDRARLDALRAEARSRWAALGFHTRVAELDGVHLQLPRPIRETC